MNIMKGFTLIETVIYITLFSVLLFGLVNMSYLILQNLDRHDTNINVLEEGTFIVTKIDWLLTAAQTVYEPVLNSSSTVLRLKSNESLYRIELNGTDLLYKKDYDDFSQINNNDTKINDFLVEHGQTVGNPAWVKVSFTIQNILFTTIRYTRL